MSTKRIGLALLALRRRHARRGGSRPADQPAAAQIARRQGAEGRRHGSSPRPASSSRVRLPDRSLVFVRQGTTLAVTEGQRPGPDAPARCSSRRPAGKLAPARDRQDAEAHAAGAATAASASAPARTAPRVVVAAGSVKVERRRRARSAAGSSWPRRPTSRRGAPRVSHLVGWTRELRNGRAAGAGQRARRRHADRARPRRPGGEAGAAQATTSTSTSRTASPAPPSTRPTSTTRLDRLEGTFHFPLPPDASLSRLAMYVDGNLMEGGMAERDHARDVYETHRLRAARPGPAGVGGRQHVQDARLPPGAAPGEAHPPQLHAAAAGRCTAQPSYRFPAGHIAGRGRPSGRCTSASRAARTWPGSATRTR